MGRPKRPPKYRIEGENVSITCANCDEPIAHDCHSKLGSAVEDLFLWSPMYLPPAVIREAKKNGMYLKGDEEQPFFSEAFLYPLLGKEHARSLLARVHAVIRAMGIDPEKLEEEITRMIREEQEEDRRLEEGEDK